MRHMKGIMITSKNSARHPLLLTLAALAFAVILSACSENTFPDNSFAVIANADIGTGQSRIQIGVVSPEGERLGSPDDPISVEIAPTDGSIGPTTYQAEWMWLIEDVVGLYKTEADLSAPGVWALSVVPENGPNLPPTPLQVLDPTLAPNVGDPAPTAPTDTLATKPLDELTTDPTPDEGFYQMTLEEAFASGRKTVVVFSTPAFCQTATCGPTLEIVKGVRPEFPDANFIHIEVYTDINAPNFSPTPEFLAPALGPEYWNLPSEPWVFVVDEGGLVGARFEGALTLDDLRESLS